ncbi:MAG: hypothetical protein U0821_18540 [Chloroflexota bacterium]
MSAWSSSARAESAAESAKLDAAIAEARRWATAKDSGDDARQIHAGAYHDGWQQGVGALQEFVQREHDADRRRWVSLGILLGGVAAWIGWMLRGIL